MSDLVLSAKLVADADGFTGELKVSQKEVAKFVDGVRQAGTQAKGAARDVDRFGDEAQRSARQVAGLTRNTDSLSSMFFNLRSAIATLGLGLIVGDVTRVGQEFEGLDATLFSVAGSTDAAASEMGYIEDQADRLGLSLRGVAKDYSQLAASSKGTVLQGQATRDIFESVSEAMVVLKKDANDTSGAMTAITQIMSKGRVQAEELRGQLGERIPGAFQIAARAMNMTTAELSKQLELGNIYADDFLPKFAAELRKTYAQALPQAVRTSRAEMNRFMNELDQLRRISFDGAFSEALTDELREITDLLQGEEMREGAKAFGEILAGGVRLASEAFQFLVRHGKEVKALLAGLATVKAASMLGRIAIAARGAAAALLAMTATPIGALIAAIGAAVAAVVYFKDETISMGGHTATVMDYLAAGWGKVADGAVSAWEAVEEFAGGSWGQTMIDSVAAILNAYKNFYNGVIGIFASIPEIASISAGAIADAFEHAIDFVLRKLTDLGIAGAFLFEGEFELAGKAAANALSRSFRHSFSEAGTKIRGTVSENLDRDWLGGWMTDAWEGAAAIVAPAIDAVGSDAAKRYKERMAAAVNDNTPFKGPGIPDLDGTGAKPPISQAEMKAHEKAVKSIEEAYLDLLPAYDRMRAEAALWRKEQLDGLDETAEGYEQLALQVEDIYTRRLKEAQEQQLEDSREWSAGVKRALDDYADAATNAAENAERVTTNAFRSMEDAIVDFRKTGEFNFRSLVDSILDDLTRLMVRQNITGPLSEALGGIFGGGSDTGTDGGGWFGSLGDISLFHSGGVAGDRTATRKAPTGLFATAQRYHGGGFPGLASDEVPAILKKGEPVFTPKQMDNANGLFNAVLNMAASLGQAAQQAAAANDGRGVQVMVYDMRGEKSAPVETSQSQGPDGKLQIKVMIRDAVNEGFDTGAFDTGLKSNYGVTRQGRR